MTLTVIAINGVDYESYASVDEANIALAVDPIREPTWGVLSDEQKGTFLISATQRLDLLQWRGTRAEGAAQSLAWPRSGLHYADGTAVPDDAIPLALQRATALLAGTIVQQPAQADHGSSAQTISEIKAGSVTIKYSGRQQVFQGQPLQDETAYELIRMWIAGSALPGETAATESFASGTDERSTFTDRDKFGRTRGI